MIDLNAHVLAGIDDGPATLDDAVRLLQQASLDGIDTVVAMAHANDHHFDVSRDQYLKSFSDLTQVSESMHVKVRLVAAMELQLGPNLAGDILADRYLAIGRSGYLCLTLPPNEFPSYTISALKQLGDVGYRMVLMHPERNRSLRRKPEWVQSLKALNVVGVAAAGSLLGKYGPDVESCSMDLIEMGFIQSVASGGHSLTGRPVRLSPVREILSRRFGEEESSWMMDEVPERILNGQDIALVPREYLGWRRWLIARHS